MPLPTLRSPTASASPPSRWPWRLLPLPVFLLSALVLYANGFDHAFHLDDTHALVSNPGIRALANIPAFFTDASYFSVLRANVDYRPVLLTSFALNYRFGGYDPAGWHAVQVLLHTICACFLLWLGWRVADTARLTDADRRTARTLALIAAVWFLVHPTASGVVNYFSARSSLLTAALLLPAFVAYGTTGPTAGRWRWVATGLYAAALLTKVEAVAALAVFFLWDVRDAALRRGGSAPTFVRGFVLDVLAAVRAPSIRTFWPLLAVTVAYFVVRARVMAPFAFDETRAAVGVSNLDYLLTQTVVWWRYVLNWLWPAALVADHGSYPVYRSLFAPPVAVAVLGWVAVALFTLRSWRSHPHRLFLLLSGLALVSPTSSILPLSEMLNEHRPYLPLGFVAMALVLDGGLAVTRWARGRGVAPRWTRGAVAVAVGGITLTLGTLTWARTEVFRTERRYLEDVVQKAPSARALMNLGLVHMRAGEMTRALSLYEQALAYAPQWYTLHINLGIVHRTLGHPDLAEQYFASAVGFDRHSGVARVWRAEHRLQQRRFAEARADFEAAAAVNLERYRLAKGLATAWAGLGNVDGSLLETRRCLALDEAQALVDVPTIATPFFDDAQLHRAGITYFAALDQERPDTWWIVYNLGTLWGRLGDSARRAQYYQRASVLRAGAG